MKYTAGSLFTGIGGIDLAFAAAGFDVRWQVEIDPYCRRVLEKHAPRYWPNAKLHEDVKHVGCEQLETVDVLFGGFPCQDISVAGKRAGIAVGTRSGLWFEFVRIIGELRPRMVLLENVTGINVLGGTTVIGDLAEIGYDAVWFPLRASDAGAPHRRERWFCVAYHYSQRELQPSWRITNIGQRTGDGSQTLADRDVERCEGGTHKRGAGSGGAQADQSARGCDQALADTGGMGCVSARDVQAGSCRNEHGCAETSTQKRRHVAHVTGRKRGGTRSLTRRRTYGAGTAQPRLGGNLARLSDWMDFPGWPAGPGHEQYAYEPPRVITGIKNRMPRIKALGNAVVPQVVFPIAVAVRAFLEAQDAAPAQSVESEAA